MSQRARILSGPPVPPLQFPERTIGEFFFNSFEKHADRICQIDSYNDVKVTYKQLKEASIKCAINLQKHSIFKSDIVAIISDDPQRMIPTFGAFFNGSIVVHLDCEEIVETLSKKIEMVKPNIIFVDADCVEKIEECLISLRERPKIVVFGNDDERYLEFGEFLKEDVETETEFRPVAVDLDEIATIILTSGSSGMAKAICHSQKTLIEYLNTQWNGKTEDCSTFAWRFYWIGPFLAFLHIFLKGGYIVYTDTHFTAKSLCQSIEKYRITWLLIAPFLTYTLTEFKDITKYDLSSIQVFALSGTSFNIAQVEKLRTIFTKAFFFNTYGATELGPINNPITSIVVKENAEGFCGKPGIGVSIKIVDPESEEILKPHQHGEIRIKTATMMTRFLDLDTPQYFDDDGFYKIKDYGYYDEDDNVYIIDKLDEIVRTGHGYCVYPGKIEQVLMSHPDVKEAAAFSADNSEMLKFPAACVVLKDGSKCCEDDIRRYADERLLEEERLACGLKIVDSIPQTATGKILRRKAKEMFMKTRHLDRNNNVKSNSDISNSHQFYKAVNNVDIVSY